MKELKFICAQPAIDYYIWQVEVMIVNFIDKKINPNNIHILCGYNHEIPENWKILEKKYNNINFYFYKDLRKDKSYIPSIYFNLLKQHIKENPFLEKTPIFLHDCDILFTKNVDFTKMLNDNIWYLSNTNSYINSQYILSKGENIYLDMCNIVGISFEIPKQFNKDSGGAQYIVKNTNYEFWDKVEKDSISLYKYFVSIEPFWKKKEYPIQKWTAGMWALLWNSWLFGHKTKVDDRLNFCWATDRIDKIKTHSILHNAGVTDEIINNVPYFYKGKYRNKKINSKDLSTILNNENSKKYCTWYYTNELNKLINKYKLNYE